MDKSGGRPKLDYDKDVLTKVNGFGRQQIFLFVLMWIPSAMSAMAVFMYSFIAFSPEHRCKIPACESSGSNNYNQDFLNITTPFDTDLNTWDQCNSFQ
jgi:hypothetical protein